MHTDVSSQQERTGESLTAHWTGIWFFCQTCAFVDLQLKQLSERLLADFAGVSEKVARVAV